MKKLASIAALVVLFVCTHAGNDCAQETVILTGEYVWDDKKGDLKAVFVETSEGGWDVRFHYTWDDEASIWEGTAMGGLSEGELRGTAHPQGQSGVTYRFRGKFVNGTFEGRYEGPIGGERLETGPLKLSYSEGTCGDPEPERRPQAQLLRVSLPRMEQNRL